MTEEEEKKRLEEEAETEKEAESPKRRGRRKSVSETAKESAAEAPKKRRGRPPKKKAETEAESLPEETAETEKKPAKRGRPRKKAPETEEKTQEKKPSSSEEEALAPVKKEEKPSEERAAKEEALSEERSSPSSRRTHSAGEKDASPRDIVDAIEVVAAPMEELPKPRIPRSPAGIRTGERAPARRRGESGENGRPPRSFSAESMEKIERTDTKSAVEALTELLAAAREPAAEGRAERETRPDIELRGPELPPIRGAESRPAEGILELVPDNNYGFIRSNNFLSGENDVYVSGQMIHRYNLRTGDLLMGDSRLRSPQDRYRALIFLKKVNGIRVSELPARRQSFDRMTPIFPNERIRLETAGIPSSLSLRVLDLLAPIGKGQRGMIVSPPKAGKTTLLKQVAKAILRNEPDMHLMILLIDERPEEVTDMREEVVGENAQVLYSTFDELPEHHKRVAEMTIERARRLVESGKDVTILLDSITRLARAYNLLEPPSGRTLSGGLDPAALHMPKSFFGAARNMREGGSLTILATALVDTGSRMDDVVYEEFKGTGNMELVLNRELQERRIFPAIDILKSGTRRDDLLLTELERKALDIIHQQTSEEKKGSVEEVLSLFERTENNEELCRALVENKPILSRKVIKINQR